MAVCDACSLDMLTAESCTTDFPVRRYGDELYPLSSGDRCRDCNAAKGQTHHVECIVAECATCSQQYVLCAGVDCEEVRTLTTGGAA